MFHLVSPRLTAPDDVRAELFVAAVARCLSGLAMPLQWLDHWRDVAGASVAEGHGVIYIHPPDGGRHDPRAVRWLTSLPTGVIVLTVALDERSETPPEPASRLNCFKLHDAQRRLGHGDALVPVAATEFAYQALAAVQPTLSREQLRLFVSYRHEDGSALAHELVRLLRERGKHSVFKDLDDIPTGADFAEVIDRRLAACDILVLLDTPRAAESRYVGHEVLTALVNHIPIVWVRVGPASEDDRARRPLPVPPVHTPALVLGRADPAELTPERVDRIVELSCESAQEHARRARSVLRHIEQIAGRGDLTVRAIDLRRYVFELREPATGEPFPRRPRTDVVQLFGRHPDEQDVRDLVALLEQRRMGPHEENSCRSFDAAVLLDPMSVRASTGSEEHIVVASASAYGDWLDRSASTRPGERGRGGARGDDRAPELLLFGAFPEDPAAQARVVAAVRAFVGVWLARGGTVTFGGHPTFTPLVLGVARRLVPADAGTVVRVYQSEWFEPSPALDGGDPAVAVVRTARLETRAASLSLMRTRMVDESRADAVVAIGGRTAEGGTHAPGIDEEVRLARAAGFPVFLVGAPGGRSTELAAEYADGRWDELGNALGADNERLLIEDDYEDLAGLVWRSVTG